MDDSTSTKVDLTQFRELFYVRFCLANDPLIFELQAFGYQMKYDESLNTENFEFWLCTKPTKLRGCITSLKNVTNQASQLFQGNRSSVSCFNLLARQSTS